MNRTEPLPLAEVDPFDDGLYTETDREYYCSWPEVAQDLVDRTTQGVIDLLTPLYGLNRDAEKRLRNLMQNLLMGRFAELEQFPALVESATVLPPAKSTEIAAALAQTVLIPFNAAMRCWDVEVRELHSKWAFG